ncbi:MAG: tetratricopeptide repeat protein [Candidatus Gastranaerophilales bacterium]|nr:tetratricopeptide repeat protein [Candidatus Gastranaerophilales bacterium]MCM1072918.1 tetratricopeptide repeat protein [Bacteroides sp.]
MRKKVLGTVCILALSAFLANEPAWSASAGAFAQHYDAAQSYLTQGQYSSAIVEFRKALRINFMDNSARIGLINSYLARATYYANQEKNYDKAANDFRSALFYLRMYPTKEQPVQNSASMVASAQENLNQCLKVIGFDRTASSRYKKAEELRAMGNFSAAAYEFSQAAQSENIASESNAQIADLMKLLGNETRSADYYKVALDLKPADSTLRMKYARTLDKLGRYDEAVVQYNAALANSKGDMEVLYALERIYLKKLAQTPSDAELNANIGAIKQAQGDFESALGYYSKAEQINPNNVNTRLNVGTLFQQKKDYAKAIKSYDSVLTLYPDNVQANLYKAQALSEMGNKKDALTLYKKVLLLDPANPTAKAELAGVMRDAMSPQEYISYLSQNSDKTNQALLYDYALKLHKENKLDEAITAYKAVINTNSSNVDAYVNLAICYAAQNDYKNAQSILNTAKSKFPANNLVLKTLQDVQKDTLSTALAEASASYENKDYKKALSQYLAVSPANEDSLLGAAACYQALENFDKAIESYQKAEKLAPNNAEIPYYIGYLYSEQQKWMEAETYLKKAVKLNPNSEAKNLLPYVLQNYSLAALGEAIGLYEKSSFESALTKFNEVLKKESNNAYAYYYRGLIYDEQKKTQLAINDYLQVLKNTNELPIANYMLAVDYDGLENYKEAYKYYNNFISVYTTEDEYLQYAKSRMEELKQYVGG